MIEVVTITKAELEAAIRAAAQAGAEAALAKFAQPANESELWDAKQAGAYLGVSAHTVAYRLAYERGFPDAINVGGGEQRQKRRWRAADIREWGEGRKAA